MGLDPLQIGAGAVAGAVVSDLYEKGKGAAADAAGTPTVQHGPVEMEMLVEIAARIEHAIHEAKARECPPRWQEVYLFAGQQASNMQPYQYKREGYKHVSILTATAFTAVVATPVGQINFSIGVGLSAFDFPSDSMIWATAAGPGPNGSWPVMLYYGDDALDIPGV